MSFFVLVYSKFKFLLKNTLVKRINAYKYKYLFPLAKTKQSWIIQCFDQPSSPAGPYPKPAGHIVSGPNPAEPYLAPFSNPVG